MEKDLMGVRPVGCFIVLILSCLGCTTNSAVLDPYFNGQSVKGLQQLACLRGEHPRDCKKHPPKPLETAKAPKAEPETSAR